MLTLNFLRNHRRHYNQNVHFNIGVHTKADELKVGQYTIFKTEITVYVAVITAHWCGWWNLKKGRPCSLSNLASPEVLFVSVQIYKTGVHFCNYCFVRRLYSPLYPSARAF